MRTLKHVRSVVSIPKLGIRTQSVNSATTVTSTSDTSSSLERRPFGEVVAVSTYEEVTVDLYDSSTSVVVVPGGEATLKSTSEKGASEGADEILGDMDGDRLGLKEGGCDCPSNP